MGLSLFNRRICNTYPGVIKTCDNTSLTTTPKPLTDGVGNNAPISLGTSSICYTGTQDFTGATVVGISGATAGLINGTGTCSMVSSGTVALLSNALGSCSIAIGHGAYNSCSESINIGKLSCSTGGNCAIAIGSNAQSLNYYFATILSCAGGIAIGANSISCCGGLTIGNDSSAKQLSVAVGMNSISDGICAVAIGFNSESLANQSVAVGFNSYVNATAGVGVAIGNASCVIGGQYNIALGYNARSCATSGGGTAVGSQANVQPLATSGIALGALSQSVCPYSLALGHLSNSCATNSIAIGCNVTANRANTLTTCELETCVAGCGLIVKTPDGIRSYRIAVDNSGVLTTTLV